MPDLLNIFHDSSGLVTVALFQHKAGTAQQHFQDFNVNVPPDMVAIGGGGEAQESPNGALLTASYPNDDLSAWLVSSKDHFEPEPHYLTAYAIGLKIQGMSREQLMSAIHIADGVSGAEQHPEASATMPSGYRLVGGGFNVEWQLSPTSLGNLATASFPETSLSWMARSKDHGGVQNVDAASPARLHVYAIGLREQLPIGRINVAIELQESTQAPHPVGVADMTPGFALTGGGAKVNWRNNGNLLWRLKPVITTANQAFEVASKDHIVPDPCTVTAYALGIQIVR
jgi:hypothetical protein